MKTLILMRHAKSDWSLGMEDHDRILNARGKNNAVEMGDWLRVNATVPDVALVSDAMRTQETWGLLGLQAEVSFLHKLYHATAGDMLELLKTMESDTVMLLGHNPDIAELANRLIIEPPADHTFEQYPTCATSIITFAVDNWQNITPATGTLTAFQTPRALNTAAPSRS